jgi:predicted DNA-binding transcriptional regulator AlpA
MSTPTKTRLNAEEAAEYVGLSVSTMRAWRAAGTGPASYKIGRRVFYDIAELDRWVYYQQGPISEIVVLQSPSEAVEIMLQADRLILGIEADKRDGITHWVISADDRPAVMSPELADLAPWLEEFDVKLEASK